MSSVSAIALFFLQEWALSALGQKPNLEDHNLSGPYMYLLTYQKCKTPADLAHSVGDTKTIPPQ